MNAGCLVDVRSDRKEMVGLGGPEELKNTRRHTGGNEVDSLALAADKVADDEAQTAGVHVRDFGEVEDVDRRNVLGRLGFEDIAQGDGAKGGVHVARGEGAGEQKDDRIGSGILL